MPKWGLIRGSGRRFKKLIEFLLYQLEQGPTELFILKQALRARTKIPQKIVDAPNLRAGLDFFYLSFQHLLTCRNMNGVIPYTDIEAYCSAHGIGGQQKDDLHYHIRKLDNAYSDYQEKKNKQKEKLRDGNKT